MLTSGPRITFILAIVGALALVSGCAGAGADPPAIAGATVASPVHTPAPPLPSASLAAPAASGGGTWQAGRYSIGFDVSMVLDLLPDGSAYLTEQPFITSRDHYRVTGDTVAFAGESCGGATGTYRWSYDDPRLRLAVVNDACAGRSALLGLPLNLLREQLPYLVVQPSRVLDQPDYNQSTVDADGHFYTTDGGPDFFEYDAGGNRIRDWRGALTYTVGITVTADGTIFVANFDDATVHAFSPAGNPVRSWQVDAGTIGPVGLAHDARGNVYVALHRQHDHYVEKYSPKGRLLGTWAGGGPLDGQVGTQPGPEEIAVTPAGTSYLGDPSNNRLVKFRPDGGFADNITGDGTHRLVAPTVVTVDALGDVFTMSLRTLWEFDDAGKVVGRWFSPYDANVVVDDGGRVWLVDRQVIAVRLPGA